MFCDTHILAFLKQWEGSSAPLDLSLSNYFRAHKNLGSHDRRYIGEAVYGLVRWQSLFEALAPSSPPSQRLHLYQQRPLEEWVAEPNLPEYARYGLSPFLWELLQKAYGENAVEIGKELNNPAPIAIRTNLLKISREKLLELLSPRFAVRPSETAPAAILFTKREPLFALPEFQQGLFEVQDEGSQLVAELVAASPKERVLDFCSGSGGKSLAIAPKMGGKGELYLHDIRLQALAEAKKRLRRAGVQNAQILPPGHSQLKKLLGKMDWVLVDVPCSGTGTLRRNPDMKWKIDAPLVERLVLEQRKIFAEALRYVKPGGKIVYVTCSLLPSENEDQMAYFLENFQLQLDSSPLKLLPRTGGPDGFFAIVFRK